MFDIAKITFHLPDSFIETYKGKQPEWGELGYITFKRTYARDIGDGKTEEYWQTCRRVVEGTFSIQKNHCKSHKLPWNETKAQRSAKKMFQLMWEFKFLPPGRGLWAMGTEYVAKHGGAALNNCFRGNTQILTDRGCVTLKEAFESRCEVRVLDGDGEWAPAQINYFGIQKLQRITLRPFGIRSNHSLQFDVTPNHRWYLSDRSVTTELKTNDTVLVNVSSKINTASLEYEAGIRHGIIFGDGTRHTYYPHRFFIRLCGDKAQSTLSILEKDPNYVSTTRHPAGDPIVTIISQHMNLKDLPPNGLSSDYYAGFINGWLLADSWNKPSGSKSLATIKTDAAEWIIQNAPYAGFIVTGHSIDNASTNFGPRNYPLHKLTLCPNTAQYWVVESIESLTDEDVYCPTVSTMPSFTLGGGIYTGNCAFVTTADIEDNPSKPFAFLMDMSMVGVGVGFDTKGANKLKIQNPTGNTVFQIPDSREGWVESLIILINAYAYGQPLPVFDYSIVRPAGAPIKGFGGLASGPEPLKEMHEWINSILASRVGQTLSSGDLVDIGNLIGRCVVAGNVRRSAEIVFGDPNDEEFVKLKQDSEKLMHHRWASNNSLFCKVGMDYREHAKSTAINGEPGYEWLDNARAFGRMIDPPDYADKDAVGGNPCLEQTLHNMELCTLVETFPARHASIEEYLETLKIAYLYAKTVTLVPTSWEDTNAVMMRNRRIGLSQSGIIRAFNKHGRRTMLQWCDAGYKFIQSLDVLYSNWLGIPRSIKKTSIKPSGTVSLLPGEPPGIHYPHSQYYIRRIRLSINSPLVSILKEAGYHVEPEVGKESNSLVVSFPIKEKYFERCKDDVSIWEQVANAVAYQKYWADNQVSITVTFKKHEQQDIPHILEMFEDSLKGISFLPLEEHGYVQAPYEAISEERYFQMTKNIKPIKFQHNEQARAPAFCDGESCTI